MQRIPWARFYPGWRWEQGEHVSIIGKTGSGKTHAALELVQKRAWVAAFATKVEDATLARAFKRGGYRTIKKWPPPSTIQRVALWPTGGTLDTIIPMQRAVFAHAMRSIYAVGRWAILLDEAAYTASELGLAPYMQTLMQQGRSLKISMICATQRPRGIPLAITTMATHMFFLGVTDEYDQNRCAEMCGMNKTTMRGILSGLRHHEFFYVNTTTGQQLISKVEK